MSILNNILGALTGKSGQGGAGDLLASLGLKLDDRASLGGFIRSLTGQDGAAGVQDIVRRFTGAGQSNAANSWVGTGQNLPVSPEAVGQAMGDDKIGEIARRFGLSPDQARSLLSQVLPQVVDRMTPNGRIE
jgi:uncharacterized protein YidB (DUF937 family)